MNESKEEIKGYFRKNRGGNAVGAILLITVGLILLANNFGVLPWEIWGNLWRFWPLLLILAGIQAVLGSSFLARIAVSVLGLIVVLMVVMIAIGKTTGQWFDGGRGGWWRNIPAGIEGVRWQGDFGERLTREYSVSAEEYENKGLQSRKLDFRVGAADMTVSDNDSNDFFWMRAIYRGGMDEPVVKDEQLGDQLSLEVKSASIVGKMVQPFDTVNDYIAVLGRPDLPTDIIADLGAGKMEVNLKKQKLIQFDLNVGAGSAIINLEKDSLPREKMKLRVGAGTVNLRVPKNVGVKIEHRVGLGNLVVDGLRVKQNGTTTSEKYGELPDSLVIEVDVGVGSVVIDRIESV